MNHKMPAFSLWQLLIKLFLPDLPYLEQAAVKGIFEIKPRGRSKQLFYGAFMVAKADFIHNKLNSILH